MKTLSWIRKKLFDNTLFKVTNSRLRLASKIRRLLFLAEIPPGPYCYTKKGRPYHYNDQVRKVNAKMCPFFQIIKADQLREPVTEDFAYCTFMKSYDKTILDESVKICGIKENFDEE